MLLNLKDVEKFEKKGGGFFRLKDDGDTAKIRIMYETIEQVEAQIIHEIQIDGFKKYVSCLKKTPDSSVSECPLCGAGYKTSIKIFVPILNVEDKQVYTWDKGKSFIPKLSNLFKKNNPLCGTVFTVERVGKKGDVKTTFEFEKEKSDGALLKDLPEIPQLLGVVLERDFAALKHYAEHGEFKKIGEDMPF
jgi:hypothetical protein